MADLTDFITPVAVASRVSDITGKSADGFTAGGYAAFVQAVTGHPPVVYSLPGSRASLVLSKEQVSMMKKWLDMQLVGAFKPKDSTLDIELNPVLVPWALKYAIPVAVLFVIIGWIGHYYFSR